MSDTCEMKGETNDGDLWPLIMCIGRPVSIDIVNSGHDHSWVPTEGDTFDRVSITLAASGVKIKVFIDHNRQTSDVVGEFVFLPLMQNTYGNILGTGEIHALILHKTGEARFQRIGVGRTLEQHEFGLMQLIMKKRPELLIIE